MDDYDTDDDAFHSIVPFRMRLSRPMPAGELNIAMKSAGFELDEDAYVKSRGMEVPSWQSDTYAEVYLYKDGDECSAHDGCDDMVVHYPLASVESSYVMKFAELMVSLSLSLGSTIEYKGERLDRDGVIKVLSGYITNLMDEWGEEPGSKSLNSLIYDLGDP